MHNSSGRDHAVNKLSARKSDSCDDTAINFSTGAIEIEHNQPGKH